MLKGKMKDYKHAVFIGRFQPFHNGHLNVLSKSLEIAEQVLILIGSCNSASNIKNPFTYEERVQMICSVLSAEQKSRVKFIPVPDYYNNNNYWITEVQNKVSQFIENDASTALVGFYKDASSYYLNLFPQWDFVQLEQKEMLNATDVREILFSRAQKPLDYNIYHTDNDLNSLENKSYFKMVPTQIINWMVKNYFLTKKYNNHCQEHYFIKQYKKQWETAPFSPIFVTTDCVVLCSGHVLVIERGFNPGKGQLALPGGFIKQNETLEDSAIRELREETNINIAKPVLKNSIAETKVFDYPNRSLRGRTITHGFYIPLTQKELPKVEAGDDANKAFWMSLSEVAKLEERFFEDHFHILNYFAKRN